MNLFFVIILIFFIIKLKISFKNFNTDYLSKESTSCVKGLFILIVFASHISSYFNANYPSIMNNITFYLGQLMVTLFIFYSGYGIYESIKCKENYINSMPVNRIFKTWIRFAIAVLAFLILSFFLNSGYDLKKILLSFLAWDSVGNSNWYIFSMLFMYILTFISFKIFDTDNKKAIIFNLFLTIIYIIILSSYKQEYWYNTILCYNLGLFYSYYKERINKLLSNNFKYILLLFIALICFIYFRKHLHAFQWDYEICSIFFVFTVILLSLKLHLRSPILKWFGDNLFWIYILQRIPMLIFKSCGLNSHILTYIICSFIVTIIITFIFKFLFDKPINILCNKLNNWVNQKISKQKED